MRSRSLSLTVALAVVYCVQANFGKPIRELTEGDYIKTIKSELKRITREQS